jgi:hypothetical protein
VLTDGVLSGRATWTPETADPVTLNLGGVLVPSSTGTLQIACKVTRSSGVGLGWAEDVGHWTGYSSPEISSAQGQLDSGGYTDTAYGIDILVTPATISEDWDITAVSGGAGGGSGTPSPLTTKGDIWAYSNTDAPFPVTTNSGHILKVRPSEPFGFRWEEHEHPPQGGTAFNYDWSEETDPTTVPIAAGEVRINNSDVSLATQIYIHDITKSGNDATVFFESTVAGDYITLWEQVQNNQQVSYQVTGATDNGTYWTYDVTYIFSSPATAYGTGFNMSVIFLPSPSDRTPLGGLQGQVLTKQTGADYDYQWGGDIELQDQDVLLTPRSFSFDLDGKTYTDLSQEDDIGRMVRTGTVNRFYTGGPFPTTPGIGGAYCPSMMLDNSVNIIDRDGNALFLSSLFSNQIKFQNVSGTSVNFTPTYTFYSTPRISADNAPCTTSANIDFFIVPQMRNIGSGTNVIAGHTHFEVGLEVNTGVTCQNNVVLNTGDSATNGTLEKRVIVQQPQVGRATTVDIGYCYGATGSAVTITGVWFLYQHDDTGASAAAKNQLRNLYLDELTGTGTRNLEVQSDGLVIAGTAALNQIQTDWIQELAEDLIKVTGSTIPTAWTTIHTETLGTDEAVRGSFQAVAKRTDAKGFSYSEKKYVVWEDGGVITEDDMELYEVGSGIAFADTRININGMDVEFQVRSVTGNWDWEVVIFNKELP